MSDRLPAPVRESNRYTVAEERANAVTHGVAAAFSLAALVALVLVAADGGGAARIVTAGLFGVTLVLLYVASTCYHACAEGPRKRKLRSLDHAAIYLLIAGSYTPFLAVLMSGAWSWTLLAVLWALAAVGVAWKVRGVGRWPGASIAMYLTMGWIGVIAARPMFGSMSAGCAAWVIGGGLAYTSGVVFYAWRGLRYHHAVWHLFVVAGSACHVVAVLRYVLPTPA